MVFVKEFAYKIHIHLQKIIKVECTYLVLLIHIDVITTIQNVRQGKIAENN